MGVDAWGQMHAKGSGVDKTLGSRNVTAMQIAQA